MEAPQAGEVPAAERVPALIPKAGPRTAGDKRVRWPLLAIDFEASGLGPTSYPIEVGIAVWRRPDRPIRTWSTLIAPPPEWIRDGEWTAGAQAIHGIRPEDLAAGMPPISAMARLNVLSRGCDEAGCDGGRFDSFWMARLAEAADLDPLFALVPLTRTMQGSGDEDQEAATAWARTQPVSHRAGADALLHMETVARALGIVDVASEELPTR